MNADRDTRRLILKSARDLIYSRSYSEVGVAAICERAGIKKGSFYHFFPSKRDLTLAVIDEFFVELKQQIFNRPLPPICHHYSACCGWWSLVICSRKRSPRLSARP
ncbi:TetR/AcrR family transcriptional regulator [endosymbiont of Riftia pachyptila]|uniref:Transcriptional regulator, TetR family n=1 Tax=endosymbiont of Riftia pachyptila (vent Ph05) TaxID=1048808 RepID=G2DGZ6_9GAMM|nr:TetR/AcrR family transcriptional regulator [endosymbiont of Riftia pachyptila]EGV50102.1 transcriptional regulator, TetR family [endosymbiont of Riftia pachyptila (vent Ph05)]